MSDLHKAMLEARDVAAEQVGFMLAHQRLSLPEICRAAGHAAPVDVRPADAIEIYSREWLRLRKAES